MKAITVAAACCLAVQGAAAAGPPISQKKRLPALPGAKTNRPSSALRGGSTTATSKGYFEALSTNGERSGRRCVARAPSLAHNNMLRHAYTHSRRPLLHRARAMRDREPSQPPVSAERGRLRESPHPERPRWAHLQVSRFAPRLHFAPHNQQSPRPPAAWR